MSGPGTGEFQLAFQLERSEKIRLLYRTLVKSIQQSSQEPGGNRMLDLGCGLLRAQQALLLKPLSSQVAEVVATNGAGLAVYLGQHLTVGGSFIGQIAAGHADVQRFLDVDEGGENLSLEYNGEVSRPVAATLITPIASDTLVLCFLGVNPSERCPDDLEILELLAEGVACMIDIQKAQAQRKLTDQAMFALGSVKTLEEYLQQAKLPEVFGVPARVVEVLQRRVGKSGLSIGDVAEDLKLSKRTLQRRLQQQQINFADLRDQIRFHYSIDYLIKQHLSIDSISASLDFSDRTSFTNAFKRWTGLSPSTFRKLFRDYV